MENFIFWAVNSEAVTQRRSVKKVFLETFCFLIKLQTWGLQFYLKRDPGRGAFLWILRNF